MTKNLLFSSVGDNTNFHKLYTEKNKNYDIYVIYYGDDDTIFNTYKDKVKFIEKRKGSKFQNFYYFYNKYNNVVHKYDYFFIIDDDIVISTSDINKMFEIADEYKLSICAPSFDKESKVSHLVTKNERKLESKTFKTKKIKLKYTNFVEVNTPLFNKQSIINLMKVYDPILVGWGIDFLYIFANGLNEKDKYAIINEIKCINPIESNISELYDNKKRRGEIWESYSKKINCPAYWKLKTYKKVYS